MTLVPGGVYFSYPQACKLLQELQRRSGEDSLEVKLTLAQLRRYVGWFAEVGAPAIKELRPRVERMMAVLDVA
jgi:hypothetical protein